MLKHLVMGLSKGLQGQLLCLPSRIVGCTFDGLANGAARVAHKVPYTFVEGDHAASRSLHA